MSDILKDLEEVRDKIKGEKARNGVGCCLVCATVIDDPEQFICGHPQCAKELREVMGRKSELFDLLGAKSLDDAQERMARIRAIIKELKKS